MTGGRDRQLGAVLLNALVLVGAISAAAAGVLSLAGTGTARMQAIQGNAQAGLYLDAGEDLVAQILGEDFETRQGIDHNDEIWATEDYAAPIGRGVLSGRIHDLQGRFNLNRLSDPEDTGAAADFTRLVAALGLDASLGAAIVDFLRPDGPLNRGAYANLAIALQPAGGPIEAAAVLRAVDGMDDNAFAALAPHVSALPVGTPLNLNTASAPVLAAALPALGLRGAEAALVLRRDSPFESVRQFATRLTRDRRIDVMDGVDDERFAVASGWFIAELVADIDDIRLRREAVFRRSPQSGAVSLTFRAALP